MKERSEQKLKEIVKTSPLALLGLRNNEMIAYANNLLPYSTGFEIECINVDSIFNTQAFLDIPDIMAVNCDTGEKRFRIPNGIKGMICLYNICEQLKISCQLNEGSGIHYHVDMSDCYSTYFRNTNSGTAKQFFNQNKEWLLTALDTWGYIEAFHKLNPDEKPYNSREVGWSHNWIRFNDIGTMEIRIGEMSFDYEVLIKRIIHANQLAVKLRGAMVHFFEYISPEITYSVIDKNKIIEYYKKDKKENTRLNRLKRELEKLRKEEDLVQDENPKLIQEVISNRVKNIYGAGK